MGLGQILLGVVVLLVLGGYWWWKSGRHGGAAGYIRHRLGLRAGESVQTMWTGFFDIDRTTGEKLGEVFGVHTRGMNIMVALSSQGRLVIGSNEREMPPIGFERGQVMVRCSGQRAEMGTLAGQHGMEPAEVVTLASAGQAPLRIQLARSAAAALQSWAGG